VTPYNHQEHLYSKNRPENLAFLRRLRAVMTPYGAAAVGEVGDAQRGLEIMGEYTRGDDLMQMCYAFEFLSATQPDAARIVEVMARVDEVAGDGWACWAFSNHDVQRHASRWSLGPDAQRLFATMIMCLRGSVCLYQGEELGLPEAYVAYEDLQDPYGIRFWPEFKGRDGCRTPMVWERSNDYAGFSHAKPWLPVSPDHEARAVASQENDPEAILHHYRRAIALRRNYPALVEGSHDGVKKHGDIVYFTRTFGDQTIFCAFNLSDVRADLSEPPGNWQPLGGDLGAAMTIDNSRINLGPWQVFLGLKTSRAAHDANGRTI